MNNTKTATLGIWTALVSLVVFGMFLMKNQVQNLETELAGINKSIQDDIKTIHILKAEWSHLNSPSRLRALAAKYIYLNPVKAEQIINYSVLPFEYESLESDRKLAARKNISSQAEKNRELKILTNAQR